MLFKRKTSSIMTEGVIWKQLVSFSIPLLIGNLFQQLYNTVDSIVVGNFVSTQALAAVGSTGPVINTLVGFFMGCQPVQASSFPSIMGRATIKICGSRYIRL